MSRSDYEDQLTFAVAEYLDLRGWLYTHFPAGEYRPVKTGAKLKRMGLKRGVPDMLIFEPVVSWNMHVGMRTVRPPGIAIELKSPKGKPTKEQTMWLAELKARGWLTHVCRTIDEVIQVTSCIS